jgi:hypothetical protein
MQFVSYECCKSRLRDVAHVAYIASVLEPRCNKHLFKNVSSNVYCNRFDLNIAYAFTHMLQQYVLKCFIAASVFMLQVTNLLSGCCVCFHTYVASVYSKCFIYFRRMLHSSVLCCTESQRASDNRVR